MTWVRAQAESLQLFTPWYVGPRGLNGGGLALPRDRTLVLHRMGGIAGRVREAPFKVFGFAPMFVNRLKKLRPSLVHAHGGPAALMATHITRALGIPLIASFHGSEVSEEGTLADSPHYSARAYSQHRDFLVREAGMCLAVSRFIRERLLEQGFPQSKTIVHYIGVDTHFFSPDAHIERQPVVLFTGRLSEVKGCEYLIAAMARVQAELPEAELVVIGDGSLRGALESAARATLRKFRFLGTQPPECVRDWKNRAQVFCVPSVQTRSGGAEAFGLVFAEAQAMQLPVVSCTSGGIVEAVADGKTGILVKEREDQALAEALLFLLKNKEARQRMGEAGRERVCKEFNLETQTRQLEGLYCQVLNEKEKRRNGSVPVLAFQGLAE